jgi:hypothetical protein
VADTGFGSLGALGFGSASVNPDRVSNVIPTQDYDRQIAAIEKQLAGLPANAGLITTVLGAGLKAKLLQLQKAKSGGNGLPPAPDAPGSFASQDVGARVGLDSLTIPLPY